MGPSTTRHSYLSARQGSPEQETDSPHRAPWPARRLTDSRQRQTGDTYSRRALGRPQCAQRLVRQGARDEGSLARLRLCSPAADATGQTVRLCAASSSAGAQSGFSPPWNAGGSQVKNREGLPLRQGRVSGHRVDEAVAFSTLLFSSDARLPVFCSRLGKRPEARRAPAFPCLRYRNSASLPSNHSRPTPTADVPPG